ncbi:hypothetical protein SprV_0301243700 [Sparganum proliferum]
MVSLRQTTDLRNYSSRTRTMSPTSGPLIAPVEGCSVSCTGRQNIMPQTRDKRTIKVMAPCSHLLCADWPPISL